MSKSAYGFSASNQAARTRWLLGFVNFVAGAAVMMIEISGNRLIAPVFGNSIYTWTALIGVVLVSFSVGNWLGGRIADQSSSPRVLFPVLLGAGFLTGAIPWIAPMVAPMFVTWGLISGPCVLSVCLFLVPGVLLGMVAPMAVRWHSWVGADQSVGASVGMLGMLGSLGSVVGTLATGFYLLPELGVRHLLLGSALLLCSLSFVPAILCPGGGSDKWKPAAVAAACVMCWFLGGRAEGATVEGGKVVFSKDTFYHKIRVVEYERPAGRKSRVLMLDSTVEGGIDVDTRGLVSDYQHFWELIKLDETFDVKRALFLGAGAFGMPEHVSMAYPRGLVDVAEIDPEVVQVGRDWFFLNEYPAVKAHAEDARYFLLRENAEYDFIFADAYNGKAYIPPHLLTKEFFTLVKSRMTEKGILMMNVISAVKGPRAELGMAVMRTLREVFPHVRLYAMGSHTKSMNLIFVAGKNGLERFDGDRFYVEGTREAHFLNSLVDEKEIVTKDAPVFTDDHNSVEGILARQLRMGSL